MLSPKLQSFCKLWGFQLWVCVSHAETYKSNSEWKSITTGNLKQRLFWEPHNQTTVWNRLLFQDPLNKLMASVISFHPCKKLEQDPSRLPYLLPSSFFVYALLYFFFINSSPNLPLLSSILRWLFSSLSLYLPSKGYRASSLNFLKLLLPLSVSLIERPHPDPWEHCLMARPSGAYQADLPLDDSYWHINYPHIFNLNFLPGDS